MVETVDMIDNWPQVDGRWNKPTQDLYGMMHSLAITVSQLRNDLNNMRIENARLKKELEDFKFDNGRVNNNPDGAWGAIPEAVRTDKSISKKSELRLIAKLHNDMNERNKIDKNLIVSGLIEKNDQASDSHSIDELVEALAIDKNRIKRKFRLRKKGSEPQPDRPSLVLIEFDNSQTAEMAITNAKKLADLEKFKKVYVRRDKTAVEREAEAMMREECSRKNKALPLTVDGQPNLHYDIDPKSNKQFHWGVRRGRLVKIFQNDPRQVNVDEQTTTMANNEDNSN